LSLFRCEGIILRVRDFGEADRILTILSPDEGKFEAVARGARRTRSRHSGSTQQFSRGQFLVFRGRNIDTLSQVEMLPGFPSLTTVLEKMAYASYVAELIDRMTGERERSESLFSLALATFRALDEGSDPAMVTRAFEIKFMSEMGFQPELERCVGCGAPEAAAPWLGPGAGGLLCAKCRTRDVNAVAFSPAARETAKRLLAWDYRRIPALSPGSGTRAELDRAFRAYVDHRVERRLRSLDFIEEITSIGGRQEGESGSRED
jgi:DNA repair protein RecO (recombination protein O)